jgi:hypothetical protein
MISERVLFSSYFHLAADGTSLNHEGMQDFFKFYFLFFKGEAELYFHTSLTSSKLLKRFQ